MISHTALVEQVIDSINIYASDAWDKGYAAGYYDGTCDTHDEYEIWMRPDEEQTWVYLTAGSDPFGTIRKTQELATYLYTAVALLAQFEIRWLRNGSVLSIFRLP